MKRHDCSPFNVNHHEIHEILQKESKNCIHNLVHYKFHQQMSFPTHSFLLSRLSIWEVSLLQPLILTAVVAPLLHQLRCKVLPSHSYLHRL